VEFGLRRLVAQTHAFADVRPLERVRKLISCRRNVSVRDGTVVPCVPGRHSRFNWTCPELIRREFTDRL
jgi:hypothetical protein